MLSTFSFSSDNLIESVIQGYQETYYNIIMTAASNTTILIPGTSTQVTMTEIYSLTQKYLEELIQQSDLSLDNTVQNFPFMFFWENRDVITGVMSDFCSTIIQNNRDDLINQLTYFVLGLSISMSGFLVVSFGIFAVIIFKFKDRQRLINLFRHLSKDEVGKIYNTFVVDDQQSITSEKKNYTMKWMRNPVVAVPVFLLTSFVFGGVAFAGR